MLRLLFEKTGKAVWISHLDLMRVFQRAFKRAGLPLTHTQGFNPRPSVSIALPLSVGVSSDCELLDFALMEDTFSFDEIKDRLNACLVEGVKVLQVYSDGRKIRDLSLLKCQVQLEYDAIVPECAASAIEELFQQEHLLVSKKTKSGVVDQDIIPMIRELSVRTADEHKLVIDALICCQNPTLNPAQLATAVSLYLPEYAPSFSKCHRIEIYDAKSNVFR